MARLGRCFLPDQPLHVIQRGNDRQPIFFAPDDYCAIEAGSPRRIHAYVLMTNHVHLLATPAAAGSLPRAIQALGRRYVRHVNALRAATNGGWAFGDAHFQARIAEALGRRVAPLPPGRRAGSARMGR